MCSCGGSKPKKPASTSTTLCPKKLTEQIEKCDGGSDILEKAKKANGGKEPTIEVGTPTPGFDAETDTENGIITVNKKSDPCTATESLFFELANLSKKSEFDKIFNDADAGKLSREEYIKAIERVEYNNIQTTLETIKKCKKTWGCKKHTFDLEGFKGAKNFDDYYKNYVSNSHKESYGKHWDANHKTEYDKKHP